tara:strand:+ start:146 stop:253 length:108 start_codon:yes stop_codon:yes gene_type:complete
MSVSCDCKTEAEPAAEEVQVGDVLNVGVGKLGMLE